MPADDFININTREQKEEEVTIYARTKVYRPEEAQVVLGISMDDYGAVWVNGKLMAIDRTSGRIVPDELRVAVKLESGLNEIVIAIGSLEGEWGCSVRIIPPEEFNIGQQR
jgi:hypothetical protein